MGANLPGERSGNNESKGIAVPDSVSRYAETAAEGPKALWDRAKEEGRNVAESIGLIWLAEKAPSVADLKSVYNDWTELFTDYKDSVAAYFQVMGATIYVPYRVSDIAVNYVDIRQTLESLNADALDPYVVHRAFYVTSRSENCGMPLGIH